MGYSTLQAKEFIDHIAPIVQAEAKKRGYKICSTTIAQAIIEGACNTSTLAKKYHNHFGLKCGKAWLNAGKPSISLKTKEEYKIGTLSTISDFFRVFSDDTEGIAGYYDFISAKRYENLKTATSYSQFAEFLKKDGYATSSTYVNTLCSTVTKWGLTQYDDVGTATATSKTSSSEYPELYRGLYQNAYVLNWQLYLSQCGYYNSTVDGIFGLKTEQALKNYQKAKGLPVDGRVTLDDWQSVGK